MGIQDNRKPPGPDDVFNWIMKKCSKQQAQKIHIVSS